jgi:outer membrane lipoprotein-sorting protein
MKKNINRYAKSLMACVAFYFVIFVTFAKITYAAEKIDFLKEYSKELAQVENYLNNISTLSAKFIQETSNKPNLEGKFFLSRPGKMRIEYLYDPKIIIVVNGSVLAYHDVELDEISNISTNTTPASFLTRENISFSAKDVEVTNVKKSSDQIKISLVKKNRKEAGEFSLIFTNNPLRFLKMEVKNDLDQVITVTLRDLNFSNELPKNLFIIKNKNLPQ